MSETLTKVEQIERLIASKPRDHWDKKLRKYTPQKICLANGIPASTATVQKAFGRSFDLMKYKRLRECKSTPMTEQEKQTIHTLAGTIPQVEIAKLLNRSEGSISKEIKEERTKTRNRRAKKQAQELKTKEVGAEHDFKILRPRNFVRASNLGFI